VVNNTTLNEIAAERLIDGLKGEDTDRGDNKKYFICHIKIAIPLLNINYYELNSFSCVNYTSS